MHKDQRTDNDNYGGPRPGAEAPAPEAPSALSRRQFVTALTLTVGAVAGPARLGSLGATAAGEEVGPATAEERREQAYDVRHRMALAHTHRPLPKHPTNGDDERYANRIGSYSKALPHDARGEVDPDTYAALLDALTTGESAAFEAIPLGGTVALVNPLAMLAFVLAGADSHELGMSAPPAFASEAAAGEMAELYWQALTRDVPFSRYGTEPLTRDALQDLARFSAFPGVEADTLFRGLTPGDATGPYLSQFLVQPIPFGSQTLVQTYRTAHAGDDHVTTYAAWLDLQNGVPASTANRVDPVPRYLRTGRDLAEFVHGCQSGCPRVWGGGGRCEQPLHPPDQTRRLYHLRGRARAGSGRAGGRAGVEGLLVSEVDGAPPAAARGIRRARPPASAGRGAVPGAPDAARIAGGGRRR